MDKCRLCLKHSKKLRSIYEYENGITFYDMLTYFTNLQFNTLSSFPEYVCLSCRKRLTEAYTFKIEIERSEMILNETAGAKRIIFYNIRDTDIKVDYKPIMPSVGRHIHNLFKNNTNSVTYNNTIITKLFEDNIEQENQMSVKDFLNSVKMESDVDYLDQDFEIEVEYDSDSDYNNEKILTMSKKGNKKYAKKLAIQTESPNPSKKRLHSLLKTPIKPIYLRDVKIDRSREKKHPIDKPKKKYPVKTSICPHCGKVLASKYINIHILQHTGVRSYRCNECSKTFLTEKHLSYHQRIHTAPKMFKCNQCHASFICNVSLKSHMLVHSEEKQFTCEICSKGFKRKCALKRHLMIHNFGKKPIQCELCPMSFHTKGGLKHHMRIHTGERPYKCELCSQPYSYKHDFNRHCLKKHGIFLKQRRINIMTEQVLQQERALMKELVLKAQNGMREEDIPTVFEDAKGALALRHAMKAVEARQIPIN